MNDIVEILNRLLEISIYSAVLFFAIIALKKALKKRMSPALHFMIWFILVARLCLPVTIDSGIKLIVIPDQTPVQLSGMQDTALTQDSLYSIPSGMEGSTYTANNAPYTQQTNTADDASFSATERVSRNIFPQIVSMKWTDIIIAVWIFGILVRMVLIALSAAKMNRVIAKRGLRPPSRMKEALKECKAELGIKKDISLFILPNITTPALTIGFKPKIIIPDCMAKTMSDEEITFAVKHELMHYKRKDHLTSIILRILEAIYWFNPIIWLMNKCVIADMETACDSMVVKTLDKRGRKQYVLTLLYMFSQKKSAQFLLGMALGSSGKIVEKRIRGVYMKNKSGRSVKVIAAVLSAVLFICCFTTACQPTPEEAIVVGKDSQNMLDMAQQSHATADTETTIKEGMDIPDRYTCDMQSESGLVTLAADTQITVPEVPTMPVTRVKMRGFTQEETDKLIEVLMRDNPIYETPERTVFTKEQLNERLIETRRMLASGDYDAGLTKENIEEKISWYEERIPDAPETLADADLTPSDGRLTDSDEGDEYLSVLANLGHAYFAHLRVTNDLAYNQVEVYFSSGWNWDGQPKAAALDLTQQEAQQEAEAFLAEMGHEDMSLINCFKDSMKAPAHETWVLDYASQINGISVSTETDHANAMSSAEGEEAQAYAPTWRRRGCVSR